MYQFPKNDPPRHTAYPIDPAGYAFIGAGAFITAVFALLSAPTPAIVFMILTLFVCFFFRDPDRLVPAEENAIVSPADGKIIAIAPTTESPFGPGDWVRISIFMSIFNVHVNRVPYTGKIETIDYFPGKFVSAHLDKASTDNERNAILMKTEEGFHIGWMQIAGLIARRIICRIQPGDGVQKGQRFGVICFGSRVDTYLPGNAIISIAAGEHVKAGATVIARMP
ncbi:phosphatidylserine decarboxylase family protein [Desulfatirhabdium butyrativorans]|uniref:phosphatidylserine decarboxylase family protein n=1 Tax=Desulfatirhabdium butyrativorans TaxID=340467 RepID=UPI0004040664|nr:phosphatidylserine decarboxylase family protein [Desulfatirhabdium butyrativorans]